MRAWVRRKRAAIKVLLVADYEGGGPCEYDKAVGGGIVEGFVVSGPDESQEGTRIGQAMKTDETRAKSH